MSFGQDGPFYFMDNNNYEQIELGSNIVSVDQAKFLIENDNVIICLEDELLQSNPDRYLCIVDKGRTDGVEVTLSADDVYELFTIHTIKNNKDPYFFQSSYDSDNDGDPDIFPLIKNNKQIIWYENVNSTNTIPHEIASGFNGTSALAPIDVDGDGDPDVITAYYNKKKN